MVEDTFWRDLAIPYQDQFEDEFEFANPVQVSQSFIRGTALSAQLAEQAEALAEELANFEVLLSRSQRKLGKLRRELLANHFSGIKTSASSEIQDAYILTIARDDGRLQELEDIEEEIDRFQREIELREPRLAHIRSRLKRLDKKMDWAKQYLDYEKLMTRIGMNGRV